MSTPPAPTSPGPNTNGERRTSFNFLRQQSKTGSGTSKMIKKQKQGLPAQYQQPTATVPMVPPQLPSHSPLAKINTFGGENGRPDSYAIISNQQYNSSLQQHQQYQAPQYQNDESMSPHAIPMPPMPSSMPSSPPTTSNSNGGYDPYSSAVSASTGINSPRRVRRRKDPTPFNILVIGESNSGKSSFIDFLHSALASSPGRKQQQPSPPQTAVGGDSPFTPHYLETDVDQERIGVTLWDSQGLEKKFVDLQLREMASFLESKFEETFTEEQKVVRAPGVRDTHIHCVFLILDPRRLDTNLAYSRKLRQQPTKYDEAVHLMGVLDEDLDIQVLRNLQGKTTVIPVISKADTITASHMSMLKRAVWDSLKQAKLDPLEALNIADDDEDDEKDFDERDEDAYLQSDNEVDDKDDSDLIDDLVDRSSDGEPEIRNSTPPTSPPKEAKSHRRSMSGTLAANSNDELPFLPLSILSPDSYEPGVVGRRFPWGFADPYNQEHCDFVRLKDAVFSEWRAELREASREIWYEGWRTSRLKKRAPITSPSTRGAVQNFSQGQSPRANTGIATPNPTSGPETGRGAYRNGGNAY
ncbi:hypothetical protein EG328_007886 [Venturia inaequalis]|uniref:Septin-type G domain-containing protein n=1 Tax=Venturia inaequalis TaxID=5025 RepID=A0A8H3VAI4_VENIN|nr:hypothetical protein EG328_007886 [Venturia inaequalis]